MRKHSTLLLVAGVVAGGCSRDGPTAVPEVVTEVAAVAPQAAAASPTGELTADAIDDALGRLVPALGDYGTTIKSTLLKLRDNRSDQAARKELRRVLDLLDATLPAPYRADLDAMRLELGVAATK